MTFNVRRRRRALSGIGVLGAGVLFAGLTAAPALAQEEGVALEVSADQQVVGAPGDIVEIAGESTNIGTEDIEGGIVDVEVPEGTEIVGIVGQEISEGTERPDEGCALESPQKLVCGTQGTVTPEQVNEATYEVQIAAEAQPGELGTATTLAEGDNGGSDSADTVISVTEEGVALNVTADDEVRGVPGEIVEVPGSAANVGSEDVEGGIVDFEVPEGAEIVGVVDQEISEGTERPDEGCALESPQKLVCGTQGTVSPEQVNEATYEVQIAADAQPGELGTATTLAEGDNGGSDSAETAITVTEEGVALDVTADEQVEAEPGQTVEIAGASTNTGSEAIEGGIVDFEVPEGAEIVGVVDQEISEGTERPDEGCALESPQKLVCGTQGTVSPGQTNEATYEVQITADAQPGELGTATTLAEGNNGGSDTAETVITVAGTDEPTEEPTDEPTEEPTEEPTDEPTDEPTEEPTEEPTDEPTDEPTEDDEGGANGDDENLPDTGSSNTPVMLAAAGLLLVGGAAMALRAQRS